MDEMLNIYAKSDNYTVATRKESPADKQRYSYQSEAQLEKVFIDQLKSQGYEYVVFKDNKEFVSNLRKQLSILNDYNFSDSEWDRLYGELSSKGEDRINKTKRIQDNPIVNLIKDDGLTKNIKIIDKEETRKNYLQVMNQYTEEGGHHKAIYDVTILVNGLPLVHVELKRRGIDIREAFNQIKRYSAEAFWATTSLFDYVQIFVISNGTQTKYFSNSIYNNHLDDGDRQRSKSFEFTMYWSYSNNEVIYDLEEFTETFFGRSTLLDILTKYCVLQSDDTLLVMRPYQIAATERILRRIVSTHENRLYGTTRSGGFIWHTTGSGKTLTSFKAAQLATKFNFIEKVLFVVDRKDLDAQTQREYDKFEKGSANGNTSTAMLTKQMSDPNAKIIITTIQKLSIFLNRNKKHELLDKEVVLIFDECHRSQFGKMSSAIAKSFKKYYLFGFTGTPIFPENSGHKKNSVAITTDHVFGQQLHQYTIVDAMNDANVLGFNMSSYMTARLKDEVDDENVEAINKNAFFENEDRIDNNVREIIKIYDKVTLNRDYSSFVVTHSIKAARTYYDSFKEQKAAVRPLKVAMIYSFSSNTDYDEANLVDLDEPNFLSLDNLDKTSRDHLEVAIQDYNEIFGTSFSTESGKFEQYYQDVSRRVKNVELDILIVVNMFLTGFDSPKLNTLFVDKKLKQHGLIQAFSRTNRVHTSRKGFGNVVTFVDLEDELNEALRLFGSDDAKSIIIIRSFQEYYEGYKNKVGDYFKGYADYVREFLEEYGKRRPKYSSKEDCEKYINLFNPVIRMMEFLSPFTEFTEEMEIITPFDKQEFFSHYLEIKNRIEKRRKSNPKDINDDIIFETRRIKSLEIDLDYVMNEIGKIENIVTTVEELDLQLRKFLKTKPLSASKRELIEKFLQEVNSVNYEELIQFSEFVQKEINKEVKTIIEEQRLREPYATKFINKCINTGKLELIGEDFYNILEEINIFSSGREKQIENATNSIQTLIDKYYKK